MFILPLFSKAAAFFWPIFVENFSGRSKQVLLYVFFPFEISSRYIISPSSVISDKQRAVFRDSARVDGAIPTVREQSYPRGAPRVVHADSGRSWLRVFSRHTQPGRTAC